MAEKSLVKVATNGGGRTVEGEVYGRYAVTPKDPVFPQRGEWNVTHVASGCDLRNLWGNRPLLLKDARKVARWLDEHSQIPDDCEWGSEALSAIGDWVEEHKEEVAAMRETVCALLPEDPTP